VQSKINVLTSEDVLEEMCKGLYVSVKVLSEISFSHFTKQDCKNKVYANIILY